MLYNLKIQATKIMEMSEKLLGQGNIGKLVSVKFLK